MIRHIDIEELPPAHPVVIFHGFWRGAAGENKVAPWSSFDAADHPRILPWVMLFKREDAADSQSLNFRYAVCGTGCTELFGFSYQGKLFGDNLPPDAATRRREEFERVMQGSGPLYSLTQLPIPNRESVSVYRGVFPFANDGHGVDRIIVVLAEANFELA